MPLLVSGAIHSAPGHPRSGGRSEGFLLFPVLPKTFFFFFNPFKAIRFFSLFPLLSSSTPSPSLGALPSRGPAPGQTLRPSSFQPVVAGPRNSGGGCWTKGGGAGGGGRMRLLQCPLPTLHRPWPAPPFSGLRAALAGLKLGPVFFAPSAVVRGPDGFSQALQVPSPLSSPSRPLPSRSSQQSCPSREN